MRSRRLLKTGNECVKGVVDRVAGSLRERGVLDESTIVLIGSASRGTMTDRSDVDLLVITPCAVPRMTVPVNVHVHLETRAGFTSGLQKGDDFRAWALRFGQVVHDPSGWWGTVSGGADSLPWPDWFRKLQHAKKRIRMGKELIGDGDLDAAQEEYLMAVSHLARAILLKSGVFPLSRAEMPAQLNALGYTALADILSAFITGIDDWDTLLDGARTADVQARLIAHLPGSVASDARVQVARDKTSPS